MTSEIRREGRGGKAREDREDTKEVGVMNNDVVVVSSTFPHQHVCEW